MYEAGSTIGKGPKYTFKNKPQDARPSDAPGPGTYDGDTSAVRDRVPAYKMSPGRSSGRGSPYEQSPSPAPGSYDVKAPRSQYAATITGRPADRLNNDAPGPGTYEGDLSAVKDKVPSYRMSPTKRSGLVNPEHSSSPAPGSYDVSAPRSKYAATITGNPADKNRNDSPGPGAYEGNDSLTRP